jgi:hypothetical protein
MPMQTQTTPENQVAVPDQNQIAVPAAPVREDVFEFIRRDSVDAPMDYVREINVPGGGE